MTRIDKVTHEYGLSEEQAIMFEHYACERYAAHIWINSYVAGKSANPEEWYEQMASENLHTAHILSDVALDMWNLDMRAIYNELVLDEVSEIVRGL